MASKSKKFEDILRLISSPGSLVYKAYLSGISAAGYLDCPSPPWDKDGTYRLVAESGSLVIQKLVSGSWERAETTAPIEVTKPSAKAADDALSTKTRSILFMDVSGWSKLPTHELHAYVVKGLRALSEILYGYDFINTWGDSIVATFESAKTAAENALRIQDFFANSYPDSGVSSGLTCRVSLHSGEVICCRNPLRNEEDIFGESVHLAARLEPVTVPGAIFCTQAFADQLQEVQGSAPRAWPLGPLDLAKGFGQVQVFVVSGPNAQDPRRLYEQVSGEASRDSKTKPVPIPDASAVTRLKGWLNKLPSRRSGEAIALDEIENTCRLEPGQAFRLISGLVGEEESSWVIDSLTPHDIILKFVRPPRGRGKSWVADY